MFWFGGRGVSSNLSACAARAIVICVCSRPQRNLFRDLYEKSVRLKKYTILAACDVCAFAFRSE